MASRRAAPAALDSHGRCVLVIDDEPQVLHGVRHMLEGQGCEVLLAESARDALRVIALAEHAPEAIVSDYRLRDGLDGIDAIGAVRESLGREVPAVIITGDTSPERLKEVARTGLELLHKPLGSDELCRVLGRLLSESSNRAVGEASGQPRSAVPARAVSGALTGSSS